MGRGVVLEQVMEIDRDDGEPVGVTVDDHLKITKIVAGSLAEEAKLRIGDQITSVNGSGVADKERFYAKLRFAHPRLRLTFKRDSEGGEKEEESTPAANAGGGAAPAPGAQAASAAPTSDGIPAELERFLKRREGFSYLVAFFDWPSQQDRQLGIVLATRMHKVIVGSLKSGSLGEEQLKLLDRIVAVNASPVSDKDIAKHLIVASGGKFTALVERPMSEEAKKEYQIKPKEKTKETPAPAAPAKAADAGAVGGDPSILPHDCLAIAKAEREARERGERESNANGSILLKAAPPIRSESKTAIGKSTESEIGSDIDPNKRLRKTPKQHS